MIRDASRKQNSSSLEQIKNLSTSPSGHTFLVYGGKTGWQPYKLVRARDTEVDVVPPSENISTFSINVLPPLYERNVSQTMESTATSQFNETRDTASAISDDQRTIITKSPASRHQGD